MTWKEVLANLEKGFAAALSSLLIKLLSTFPPAGSKLGADLASLSVYLDGVTSTEPNPQSITVCNHIKVLTNPLYDKLSHPAEKLISTILHTNGF